MNSLSPKDGASTAVQQDSSPIIEVQNLSKHFTSAGSNALIAVNDVSLSIRQGEVLGIVGESGCGKSTLGRTILRLLDPTEGRILFSGQDITSLRGNALKSIRKEAQIVFQDPFGALNPQHTIEQIVGEPLVVHKLCAKYQRSARVATLLDLVGLPKGVQKKFPHEFSGGQRQRIAIARALASNPTFLVCDEAVSALDVSVQSQILNLLLDLREQFKLAMMFISHDLSVIRHISDRISVMYLGRVIESAPTEQVMANPQHPYTQALLSAVPHPLTERRERIVLRGEIPDPADPPSGCVFHTRCHKRIAANDSPCVLENPPLIQGACSSQVACHLVNQSGAGLRIVNKS